LHGERSPSFCVYADGHYHCFGCRAHGDVIDYMRLAEGFSFHDAVLELAHSVGIRIPDNDAPEEAAARRRAYEAGLVEERRIREAEQAAELANDTAKARAIIAETIDWRATPAIHNWRDVRGIPKAAADRSTLLRWHEGKRALVVIATDAAGRPTSGQTIHWWSDGSNVRHNGKNLKLTFGQCRQGALRTYCSFDTKQTRDRLSRAVVEALRRAHPEVFAEDGAP
jgi:CHC2 zinc finger